MSNENVFFIVTVLIVLFIFDLLRKVRVKKSEKNKEEKRSGNDRRKLFMYRIPERRGLPEGSPLKDRRGGGDTLLRMNRRNGKDRRCGAVRRKKRMFKIPERRLIANRRNGLDRRKKATPPDPVVA